MANIGAAPPTVQQGYGKAILGTLVQPFVGALAAVVIALVEAKIGHPLGDTLSAAVTTLIGTPITAAAILLTPHNLFSGAN